MKQGVLLTEWRANLSSAWQGRSALTVIALVCTSSCSRSIRETAAPPAEPAEVPSAPVTPSAPAASQTTGDKLLVTEAEYQGWKYFAVYCERCHAPDAVGTADAPDLRYSVSPEGGVTADSFKVIVRKGTENREENKVMKGFEDVLDDQRIDQIYAYIMARSEDRLAPGRPHRASSQ
jgi:mono/diheme cytochrome c family protein